VPDRHRLEIFREFFDDTIASGGAALGLRSWVTSPFGFKLHHSLDFHRDVERQLGDADRRAGVASRVESAVARAAS
jgi:hypothetical protein